MANPGSLAQPWLEFEKQIGRRPQLWGPIEKVNEEWEAIGVVLGAKLTVFPTPDASITIENKEISAAGLKVRIYTPPDYVGDRPVVIHCHAGGWAMGDVDGEDVQLRLWSKTTGLVIVAVEYRLAPQHPFPAGLDDCLEAYHWALANTASLRTAPGQAITMGTSAGGNLAIATAVRLIDEGHGDTLMGIVPLAPVTTIPSAVPEQLKTRYTAYAENSDFTINTAPAMHAFAEAYTKDASHPYISVLLHPRLKDLPKIYMVGCEVDTLRDDARLFKAALDEAGIPNKYDEYPGYPHVFWGFPSSYLDEIQAMFTENLAEGFRFILS